MNIWNDTEKSTKLHMLMIFTALHGMQTRSSDENSVRLSVRLSVCPSVRLSVCPSHA